MGAKMVEFNGWDMPVEYPASLGGGIIAEHMPVRTAMCSAMIPPPSDAGYSTGMSQPLNSTIFAPIWRWTAFSAVLRMAGVASTKDKIDLNQRAVAGLLG